MIRTICLTALLLALAGPAAAHPGHEVSGFLHPFTGIDHLLAMVGVGIWSAFLAVRKPAAALLVPATFLAMMAVGATAGFAGTKLPLVEAVVLGSVFIFGGLSMNAVRLPAAAAMTVAGLFAFFHGYAHALEAPGAGAGAYILGFLAASTLLQAAGLGLGQAALRLFGDLGLSAMGGAVVAGGALVLIAQ